MGSYNIIDGYKINESVSHHIDIHYTDEGQDEVYLYAKEIAIKNNYKNIIDIGCGSGFKLMKYFSDYNTIGYEVEPSITFLKSKYPDRVWVNSGESEISFNYKDKYECDIIICADVIEHIQNPDNLLNYLKSFNTKLIIISTPCRDILCKSERFKNIYGNSYYGPPVNTSHVREWTYKELIEYLSKHFNIKESFFGKNQIECQYHLISKL